MEAHPRHGACGRRRGLVLLDLGFLTVLKLIARVLR
jgi:hypothetical protein